MTIVAWMTGLFLLLTLLWATTELSLRQEEDRVRSYTMHHALSLTNSYATQLTFLAEQMNQILLGIHARWQDTPALLDLARDRERGLFPDRDAFFIYVLDSQGHLINTSGIPNKKQGFIKDAFFEKHKNNCCKGLLISMENYGPKFNDKVVYFSRRLSRRDGSFGGVAVISVLPDFLATFQDEPLRSMHDFISVRLASGPLLATRMDAGNNDKNVFYLKDPCFSESQGIRLEKTKKFRDKKARYVAWRKLKEYPLETLAGLTEEDALASYQVLARHYRLTATTANVLFLIFAAVGMWFSDRLAVRRRAEESIRSIYRLATDAANEGFYMLRPVFAGNGVFVNFYIEDCNDRAAILLDSTRSDLIGRLASETMQHKLHEDLVEICRRTLQSGGYEDEFRVPAQAELDAKWVYCRAVHSGAGIALTLRDISELKAHEQTLADLANKDALTLLPNRRWLSDFYLMQ